MNNKKPSLHLQEQNENKTQKPDAWASQHTDSHFNQEKRNYCGLKLFLLWYFIMLSGTFIISLLYNLILTKINVGIANPIEYLNVANIVLILTTALGTGLGVALGKVVDKK